MINSVVLVGRLGNDPEMRYTPSGVAVTTFRLAVNRPPRADSTEQETDWLNVVTFGKVAETVAQYLDKGALVGIEGRVQSRTWEGQDGQRRYEVEINAIRVRFLESRQEAERRRGGRAMPAQAAQRPPAQQPEASSAAFGDLDVGTDPFGDQ
ncbi:MAG: single-stranded DNA-binding protein [candidate division WS1 bacterium]|nr:single-stranded DNA-binding protein [candidate division WS1 bacterium]